jgi:RNA polymerase sigma-70 factor (ECF subfamily)
MAPSREDPSAERAPPSERERPGRSDGLTSDQVAERVVEHAADLRRFLLGMLRDPDLAADALQATLARALELGHTARAESIRGWLFQVARNEALVVRRRQGVQQRGYETLARQARAPLAPPPEAQLMRDESVKAVREAIETMPEPLQVVVLARFRDDKTFAQIAADLKLPLGTVLTRMRRASERLRTLLSSTQDDTP